MGDMRSYHDVPEYDEGEQAAERLHSTHSLYNFLTFGMPGRDITDVSKSNLSRRVMWTDQSGKKHKINRMSNRHLINTARLLERAATRFKSHMPYPDFQGEMAQMCGEQEFERVMEQDSYELAIQLYGRPCAAIFDECHRRSIDWQKHYTVPCSICRGDGVVGAGDTCPTCKGEGKIVNGTCDHMEGNQYQVLVDGTCKRCKEVVK